MSRWPSIEERFWLKVNKRGPLVSPYLGPCWLWTGRRSGEGYGELRCDGRPVRAHKWLWERLHGPVPPGLELDHLCRRKGCVNPPHLEAVTHAENCRRANNRMVPAELKRAITHCPRNHRYDDANTYIDPQGKRKCRECERTRDRQRRKRRERT